MQLQAQLDALSFPTKHSKIRATVRSLIYLATKTRPDLARAVQQVAQFCENPGKSHLNAIRHIIRYLKHTMNFGIHFSGNAQRLNAYFGEGVTNCPSSEVFADSDWANDPDKRKSVGEYVFMMHGGVIDFSCQKFSCTPLLPQKQNGMRLVKQQNLLYGYETYFPNWEIPSRSPYYLRR